MHRRVALLTLVAALALAGCGGDDTTVAESATPTSSATTETVEPTESAEPTDSSEPAPITVGTQTTCQLFFGDMADNDLANRIIAAANKTDLSRADLVTYDGLADDIEDIASRAEPDLQVYLDVQAQMMRDFAEDIRSGQGSVHDMNNFKAAGLELLNRCTEYLVE